MRRLSDLTRLCALYKIKFPDCIFIVTVMASLFCSLAGEAATREKRPTVIITVDVETTKRGDQVLALPEQVNAVCAGNISCGLQEMVRMLNVRGLSATFFLDVYEYKEYGQPALEAIAKWFDKSGQDVELHTHPQWAYDGKRNMMFQYSLEEQTRIIREGKDLLQKWTGDPVVVHRAGAYSADENTLKALIANGIPYDSSLFFGSADSRINSFDMRKNALSMYGPLYEFPVTVYRKNELPSFGSDYLPSHSRIRKYDINWFGDQSEAQKALEEAIRLKMDFVILFLHSFSFIKGGDGTGKMVADVDAIKRFGEVLDGVRSRGLKTSTFREIHDADTGLKKYVMRPDVIPVITLKITTFRYLREFINRNNYKEYVLFCGVLAAALGLLLRRYTLRNDKKRGAESDA
jgi:hypothetical protein